MHDPQEKPKPQLLQIAPLPPQRPHDHHTEFMVGLDVGSTTVKAVLVDHERTLSSISASGKLGAAANSAIWILRISAR